MSLKNKLDETKLRSLTYGDNGPYVVVNVVDQSFDRNEKNSLTDFALNLLPDNFNLLGNELNLRNTRTGAATIDTVRIGRFLTDPKHGPQFIAKQIGLQAMNVNSNFGNGPLSNQIYSPVNTIGQVALSGIGGHIKRAGLIPGQVSDIFGDLDTYESIKLKESENQLVKFRNQMLSLESTEDLDNSTQFLSLIKTNKFLSKAVNFLDGDNNIYSYVGGPESLYGIGFTNIKRYYNSLKDVYKNDGIGLRGFIPNRIKRENKDISFGEDGIPNGTKIHYPLLYGSTIKALKIYPQIDEIIDKDFENGVTPLYLSQTGSDVPSTLFSSFKNAKTYSQNPDTPYVYANNSTSLPNDNKNIVYSNQIGKTITIGGSWFENSREQRIGSGKQDQINLTPLFTSPKGQNDYVKIGDKPYNVRDLVKFRIETILDQTNSNWMIFRAYITDISDSVNADWSDIGYINRSEKLKIYNGFNRSINVSFKVASLSKEEMKPMYQKLNYLMSGMAGKYNQGLLEGTFSRITIGNYIDRQHCIIKSLTYKIPNDSPWEISMREPEGEDKLLILPHIIEVSLTLTPIGVNNQGNNELPQRTDDNNLSWIAQNDNADINYISGSIKVGTFENKQSFTEGQDGNLTFSREQEQNIA